MKNTTGSRSGGRKPGNRGAGKKTAVQAEKNPAHVAVTGEGERISKIMARAGVASRRDCERMILDGRVSLNGTVLTTPAVNCTPADVIEVDGQRIGAIERTRLWLYYKPAGLVTTNYDPEGRPTVFDNLPEDLPRVISVGRLDINTEGLLLLTNDGGLARVLELPTTGWLRRYRVRAFGSIDQAKLDSLKEGIAVDGVFYGSIDATLDRQQGHNVWITMGLREGKNREVKNVLGALGLEVNRLIRISYGPFQLGELEEGQVVEVRSRTLREQLGPRLIADAKANFDAPIIQTPKTIEPVAAEEAPAKVKRLSREEKRERDLARIDTRKLAREEYRGRKGRPDAPGGTNRGKPDDGRKEKKKRPPLGTIRTSNVWMAPGARPSPEAAGTEAKGGAKKVIVLKKSSSAAASDKPAGKTAKKPARAAAKTGKPEGAKAGRPTKEAGGRKGAGMRGQKSGANRRR